MTSKNFKEVTIIMITFSFKLTFIMSMNFPYRIEKFSAKAFLRLAQRLNVTVAN